MSKQYTIFFSFISSARFVAVWMLMLLCIATAAHAQPTFSAPEVRFDSVPICSARWDTLRFTNTLSKPLRLTSVVVAPLDPTLTIFYQPALTRILAGGESDSIIFIYAPQTTSPLSSKLKLRFEYNGSTLPDTNIPITGFGKAFVDTRLSVGTFAYDSILPCEESQLFTFLVNRSCEEATIIEIILPSNKDFVRQEPSVGNTISPGDSIRILISLRPVSEGVKSDSIKIRIRSKSGAEQWLTLKLFGMVKPKIHSFLLPDILKLDSLAPCQPFDTTITIKNTGSCDTIIVDTIDVGGPKWFSLRGAPLLPHILLPGESIDLTLRFTPGSGAIGKGSIHIKGTGIDTSIILDVNALRTGQPFILSIADSVFRAFLCTTSTRTFTISNGGCDTTIVDSLLLLGGNPQFGFSPPVQFPFKVAPGKTISFTVNFDPSQKGDSTATLWIRSLGNGLSRSVQLTGTLAGAKQTAGLELMLVRGRKQTATIAGDLDTVQLLLRDAISAARDLRKIEFDVFFYQNVLSVINPKASGGWTPGFTFFPNHLHVTLTRTTALQMNSNDELATIVFRTFIADSSYSPVWLANIKFNDDDSLYRKCVLEPLALEPVRIDLDDGCGDRFIRGYIRHDTRIFDHLIIAPNPTRGKTTISFDLLRKSDVTLSMISATGAKFSSTMYPALEKGKNTLPIPNAKLPEGFYFVKLETEGATEIRKVILIK